MCYGLVTKSNNFGVKCMIVVISGLILIRGWKTEVVPSLQEWGTEVAQVEAFEKNII